MLLLMQVSVRRARVNTAPAALAVLSVSAPLVTVPLRMTVVLASFCLAAWLRVLARAKCATLKLHTGLAARAVQKARVRVAIASR